MDTHIGDKLKAAQARQGVTGVHLARMLSTTPQQFSRWRHSKDLSVNLVLRICSALEITVSEFLA